MSVAVKSRIRVHPGTLSFGGVKAGESATRSVTITATGGRPLLLELVLGGDSAYVSVDLHRNAEGADWEVIATIRGNAPLGYLRTDVLMRTDNPDQPLLFVQVTAFIVD